MVLCKVQWSRNADSFEVSETHGWEEKPALYQRQAGLARRVKKSEMLKFSTWGQVWCLPEDVEKAKLVLLEWHEQGADSLEKKAAEARQVVAKMRMVLGGGNDAM